MPRNDFSHIPLNVQIDNRKKWVLFISRDYNDNEPLTTQILASNVTLEKCYEDEAVKNALKDIENDGSASIVSHFFESV